MLPFFEKVSADLEAVEIELGKVLISEDAILNQTATHLLRAGGKRLRPAFALLSAKVYTDDVSPVWPLAVALELIHMATLVHDDVVDQADARRGKPTVRALWGNKVSTHTGDYVLAKALIQVSGYEDPLISRVLSRTCVRMCEGEIIQMHGIYEANLRNYLHRIRCKTACLIEASCKLGAVAGGAPDSIHYPLGRFGHYLGMAFQVTDDILDMVADELRLGKRVGGDLRQGIVTIPVIYALHQDGAAAARLSQIVENRSKTEDEVGEAIELTRELGGINYGRHMAGAYLEKAIQELKRLPDVPARDSLRQIAEFIQVRSY
ncbi:MAG: polyprenyl synthetase family protein [Clostridia bacterium]|nr:polyprenyl synthetase family protein [Clostridia bacterium]MDQ7792536.1 polyprenyl synthetase family protein [Clostridia bacterium]